MAKIFLRGKESCFLEREPQFSGGNIFLVHSVFHSTYPIPPYFPRFSFASAEYRAVQARELYNRKSQTLASLIYKMLFHSKYDMGAVAFVYG